MVIQDKTDTLNDMKKLCCLKKYLLMMKIFLTKN